VRGSAGEPLPVVWKSFQQRGIVFRRGQLGLMAGPPGLAKSVMALTYCILSGVPALYISADSDAFVQLVRSICILTGASIADAERMVLEDRLGDVQAALAASPLRMCYEASPTLDTLELNVEAYEEVHGEYPHLIVVDNLSDVRAELAAEGEGRSGNLDALLRYLHEMARATAAHVLVLHHVTGAHNDGDKPIPLSGVKDQVGAVPELILTGHKLLNEGEPDSLRWSPVKNRGGRPDTTGKTFAELEFDGDHMQIRDVAATGPLGWRPAPEPTTTPEPPDAVGEEAEDVWS
jgi:AAA domain-containing protein